ncbi:UNVERIFIED_CONTAM: hypothetical protein HDU68_001333 [Siphonaria sp. JEL0065]|nr:hypothetical protein HDU68_001333 [Siphonaria sp. JEL0065]
MTVETIYIQSVVLKEDDSKDELNPGADHNDHMIVHLSNGQSKTIDYDLYTEGSDIGSIRILDGAKAIRAMLLAHEFETGNGKGYEWNKFQEWVLHKSGYQNTKWTNTHNSDSFNDHALKHLLANTHRPESLSALSENPKLENLQPATPESTKLFLSVKPLVLAKVKQLQKWDDIHNTHAFDDIEGDSSVGAVFKLKQFGTRVVEYGTIFFGKVDIGKGRFLQVRVHKYHEGAEKEVEFHSVRFTRDCGVWSEKAELVYFEC